MARFRPDRSDPTPLYQQICAHVVSLVEQGTLISGDRLPPTRILAETLGVHRSTVVRAYDEVRALGYLESRAGSYSTVRLRTRSPATRVPSSAAMSIVDWDGLADPAVLQLGRQPRRELTSPARTRVLIDFERLAADPALAPSDELRRCIKNVLLRTGGAALDYAEAAGWRPLREVIALRMRVHGVSVGADEVVITGGAQQALDMVLRFLCRRGDAVILEAPSYGMLHSLLRLHGVVPVEIPMRDDGLDLGLLERALASGPRLVYTMPNFQNPTGITTNQAHRERLLSLCEKHRVPILEDGFEEEMKFFGQAVLPIKSMDAQGIVLYVGTFSKVVFPGLRIGWVVAPRRVAEHLAAIQEASCLGGNTLAQAAAARFCTGGQFELYLRRTHRIYRRRMQDLLQNLRVHLGRDARWTRPGGGYLLWLTLPSSSEDEATILTRFLEAGVKVSPGSRFFAKPPSVPHFRLSIACTRRDEIVEGCRRLGTVLAD
ncbi:MAG: PLP-dependent aminotransferase family protein [Acidobacteriota bacterium]